MPLFASKIYHVNPMVDLSSFVESLKSETDEGIIIELSRGTYYLNKPLRFNVDHRCPMIIKGKGKAVLSGARNIDDWVIMPDGIWRTKQVVHSEINQLNVDGVPAKKAQTPNEGVYYLRGGELVTRKGNEVVYKAYLPNELLEELKKIKAGEPLDVSLLRLFTHSKANVDSFNVEEGYIIFKERYTHTYFLPSSTSRVVLENYMAALDAPGEWYQDKEGYVYYYPRKDETINRTEITAPLLKNLVTVSGLSGNYAKNITFDGLVFDGCDVTGSEKGIPPYQSAYTLDGAFLAINAKNITIANCEFRGLGGYAIWLMENCEDCVISGNSIHDVGGGGIKIGGLKIDNDYASKNISVTNNIINKYGRIYLGATGIFLTYAHNCEISHNTITDGYHTGISLGFSWGYGETPTRDNTISYNRITNLGHGLLNDFAGIYTLGVSPGTIISNNYISDVKASGAGAMGIYTDEGSSDILIENNIAYNCSGGGFHQHYGSNNIVRNNIFAHGEKANLILSVVRRPEDVQLVFENNIVVVSAGDAISGEALKEGNFIFNNNCFYEVNGKELKVNGNSLEKWMDERSFTYETQDPRLRNPLNGDYRFRSKRLARKISFKKIKYSNCGKKKR